MQNNKEFLKSAIELTFIDLDLTFRSMITDRSGSTAIVVILTPTDYICINLGDSRCVIDFGNGVIKQTTNHKPELEKERIENAGGCVVNGRINKNLAVSRAFGDFHFKDRHDLISRRIFECF